MEEAEIQEFMQYDYGETKDLLKTFISLISGTLVLSIALWDKIVGSNPEIFAKYFLYGSWSLISLSLILAGLSMCLIAAAAGKVRYGEIPLIAWSYWTLTCSSWIAIILSGTCYVFGLCAMAIAAGRSISII